MELSLSIMELHASQVNQQRNALISELPVSMAIYNAWKRLSIGTDNWHVMTALKNIPMAVFYLQNIKYYMRIC